jgi:uncharacterized membrane protein
MSAPSPDPVLARRSRIAFWVSIGKKCGYGLYLVSIVGFFVSRVVRMTDAWVALIIGSMLIGSVFLIPAIIFGYAVKAAEREDRQRQSGQRQSRH